MNSQSAPASDFENYLTDPANPNPFPDWPNYLNVYWTGAHRGADVLEEWPTGVDNIVITNGGSGYSASNPPTVIFSANSLSTAAQGTAIISSGQITSIEVTYGGDYYQVDVPTITFSGGVGTGASAIVKDLHPGGALGDYPQFNPNYNEKIIMPSTVSTGYGEWGRHIALKHELGHILDLRHTYCNGGGTPYTCSSIVCGEPSVISPSEYLEDIFGPCASSTVPHLSGWIVGYYPSLDNLSSKIS